MGLTQTYFLCLHIWEQLGGQTGNKKVDQIEVEGTNEVLKGGEAFLMLSIQGGQFKNT